MTTEQKTEFLKNGGTLLRLAKKGSQFVIKRKTIAKDWEEHVMNESREILQGVIDKLVKGHPSKFQQVN